MQKIAPPEEHPGARELQATTSSNANVAIANSPAQDQIRPIDGTGRANDGGAA